MGIESHFLSIDHLFAQKIYPTGDQSSRLFLAYLLKSAREGHLCVRVEAQKLSPSLSPDMDAHLIEGASKLPSLFGIARQSNRFYLQRNWESEQTFLMHLERLKAHAPAIQIPLQELEKSLQHAVLQPEQKRAILQAAQHTLTLICGGPGTGKTYTAALLLRHFQKYFNQEIIVAAPTGKATANIRSALGDLSNTCKVTTLHSLLTREKLYADLVLVDEGSMIDAELMAKLFAAMPSGARLILLGDKDQLPPVESGHFFADLAADATHVAPLSLCLRAELQEIVDLAASVKNGQPIAYKPLPSVQDLIQMILEKEMHVLTPLRKGRYGVDFLNKQLFEAHQKLGAKQIPIMITVNDRSLGLYNGDTGWLREGLASFGNGKQYPEYLLPEYTYAYVLSVHKSQGSEYERVMILLPEGAEVFSREMLYTAITRAKKEVLVLAAPGIVEALVGRRSERFSGLFFQ